LYIGNSNLISSFNGGICEGVLPCPFGEFGRGLELVEEKKKMMMESHTCKLAVMVFSP
jgi:hypothetical protein